MAEEMKTTEKASKAAKAYVDPADEQAAREGYVWGVELKHYTHYSKDELKGQGYTDDDIARVEKVLALKDMKIGSDPLPPPAEPAEETTGG